MKHQPNSPIVQSVEHLTVNQGVVGSSPTRGASLFSSGFVPRAFLFAKKHLELTACYVAIYMQLIELCDIIETVTKIQ